MEDYIEFKLKTGTPIYKILEGVYWATHNTLPFTEGQELVERQRAMQILHRFMYGETQR